MSALTYQSPQTYRNTFTYRGLATTIPTITTTNRRRGGGIPTVVRREPSEKPEFTPKPQPLTLRAQYDALLEAGELTEDEWAGIMLLHGVDLVPA